MLWFFFVAWVLGVYIEHAAIESFSVSNTSACIA